jgi:hypothetical protein
MRAVSRPSVRIVLQGNVSDREVRMRRKVLSVLAVTALLALGVGIAMAVTSPKITAPTKLRFRDKTVQQRFVDVDSSRSFSLGDEFVFTDVLHRSGKVAGRLGGHCTATGKHPARFECEATMKLADGTVGVQTMFIGQPHHIRLLVTGGSGTYRNARGSGVITERQHRAAILRLELLP